MYYYFIEDNKGYNFEIPQLVSVKTMNVSKILKFYTLGENIHIPEFKLDVSFVSI